MSEELLLTAYERGWNRHDARAAAGCFCRDGLREMRMRRSYGGAPTRGREGIEADIALVMEAVPDLAIEVVAAGYASDRRLWAEWSLSGTCAAEGDERHGAGRPITVLGVSVFRLSNAGFAEERIYYDSAFAR